MVTEKAAKAQVKRFAVYGDYPRLREEKVLDELVKALRRSGNTDERAERIVGAILAQPEREFCPKPGEIQAVARETADYPVTRSFGCASCNDPANLAGEGFLDAWMNHPWHGRIYAVRLCDCRKAVAE
jgi:hypothetical protein